MQCHWELLTICLVSDHILILLAALFFVISICDAGQLCSSCSDIARPGECHRHITCDDDEQCFHRQYTNGSGTPLYDLGCISSQACKYTPVMIGKRAGGPHFKCFSCCNETSLCNQMSDCGNAVSPTQNVCASCSRVSSPLDCLRQENCARDERCYVYKYFTNVDSVFYDLGCMSKSVCPSSPDLISAVKRFEDHHFKCMACCNHERMCNRNLTCDETTMPTITSTLPRDCSELKLSSNRNSSYTIYPYGVLKASASVYCEFDTDGTWTVIQRRFNGSVDFYRNWTDYQKGFGSSHGEYWIGNDIIHQITSHGNFTLKIVLTNWNNARKYAEYSVFIVANEMDNYRLTIGGYSGDARDSMVYHNGRQFSTRDRDNATDCFSSCGQGAWWHFNCCESSLNGVYFRYINSKHGIFWNSLDNQHAMKTTKMMIKRK